MKFLITLSLFFAGLLSSCSNAGNDQESADTTGQSAHPQVEERGDQQGLSGCYMRVLGRDTLVVRLEQRGDSVEGKLYFDNFQKDGSSGTAAGNVTNDTIHIYYDFHSEGSRSVMEMFFLAEGNEIIRGIGDMDVRSDTTYFTSPTNISFPGNERLRKIPCTEVPAKYPG